MPLSLNEMAKRLFLIDGNSFCYRAYYAIKELSTSYGQPTNAVYGFVAMLNKLIRDEKPDYLAVPFDLKGPTFRHKKFNGYKLKRPPMPKELLSQLPLIKEIIAAYRIPIFEREGFEADDVIATLARKAAGQGIDVYIVTGDKDILQIVDKHIKVYSPYREGLIYDEDWVRKRYGVEPEKIVEIMALMGDTTDNIPGVPGIGEKTAVRLIERFGSLEKIIANIDKIEPAIGKRIREFKEQAQLSRELAKINLNIPLKVEWENLKLGPPDYPKLLELFTKLEFKSLLRQLIDSKSQAQKRKTTYKLISKIEEFDVFFQKLIKTKEFAFDIDATGSNPLLAQMKGLSFCMKKGEAWYMKISSTFALEKLRKIFEDTKIKKITHDAKYKKIVLHNLGFELKGVCFDPMIASYLLSSSRPNHDLNELALEYLNFSPYTYSDKELKLRCCQRADLSFSLKSVLEKLLRERNLSHLNEHMELPLIDILADMEINGIRIDVKLLKSMSEEIESDLIKLANQIYEIAGIKFNINSPKQLGSVLFEKLKLPVLKKTKTGASTDTEVLERLAAFHALPATLLEYRQLSKIKSTYVDSLPLLVNPNTGRVHTSFNQTVTATGRLSSSSPNLQNIPIKGKLGRQIRKAFIPNELNNLLFSADYSQIELRILAHLSGDEGLVSAFNNGRDIHIQTASLIFNVKEENVTTVMRENAKTVNFGIIYGMSAYTLAKDLGITPPDAKKFIEAYFKRYPKVREYIEKQIEKVKRKGFVTTLLGRRRYIPDINSDDSYRRQFARRIAINAPIQGTASDLIKLAMIEIYNTLHKNRLKALMLLQLHDELVFEVPQDELSILSKMVKDIMESALKLKVPIKVTIKKGSNWLEMYEI